MKKDGKDCRWRIR